MVLPVVSIGGTTLSDKIWNAQAGLADKHESGKSLQKMWSSKHESFKATDFADVTNLARSGALCLISERAANRRYLVASCTYDEHEITDVVWETMPGYTVLAPTGGSGKRIPSTHFSISNARAREELGKIFTSQAFDGVSRQSTVQGAE